MGRGDRRTTKGKIFRGSWGKTRPAHHNRKNKGPARPSPKRALRSASDRKLP